MKQKIKFTSLALFVLIFISSCSTSSQNNSQSSSFNPYTGTKGLEMIFMPNNPPARVFENTQFAVLMRIANLGAYNVEGAYLAIGYEKDYIRQLKLSNGVLATSEQDGIFRFSVDGKSQINPFGDVNSIEFIGTTGLLESQSEEKKTIITATMCYPYKTTLSTTFCIDPDISGMSKDKKVCQVSSMDFKTGQAGPIAVTRIEPLMLADLDGSNVIPQFLIYFENLGSGLPIHPNKISTACSSRMAERDNELFNIATVKVYSSGNELLNCKPDDRNPDVSQKDATIRFRDKKDYIRCIFQKDNVNQKVSRTASAYTSPLRIEIEYGYMDTKTAAFSIYKPLSH